MPDRPLSSLEDAFVPNSEYLNEWAGQVDDSKAEHSLSRLSQAALDKATNKGVHNNLNSTLTLYWLFYNYNETFDFHKDLRFRKITFLMLKISTLGQNFPRIGDISKRNYRATLLLRCPKLAVVNHKT